MFAPLDILGFDVSLKLLINLTLAAALGALIGAERERAGKPAGARTHAMVSMGSALFAIISAYGFGDSGDAGRVAAQVVTGVGFLGAGAILRHRGNVLGLTTAASLWVTAALGLAVGSGLSVVAIGATLLIIGLLRFGPHFSNPQASE